MDRDNEHPLVAQRPTGFNGLPEPEDLEEDVAREVLGTDAMSAPGHRASAVAAWGALVAAIVAALYAGRVVIRQSGRRRERRDDRRWSVSGRPAVDFEITPPHGDKLLSGPGAR